MGYLGDVVNSITGKKPVQEDPAGLFNYTAGADGPVPGGGQVAQAYLRGKQLYGNALVKWNAERTSTAQGFGYQGDIDPNTGVMTNLRVDQTNPYGGYQLNRRAHADQWDTLRQQSAQRRIGSKGLGAQAQSDARFMWGGEDAAQAQDFISRLANIDAQQQQGYQGWQDTYWNALAEQTRQAIEDARFNQAVPTESLQDYSGYGGSDAQVPLKGLVQSKALTAAQQRASAKAAPLAQYGWGAAATAAKTTAKKGTTPTAAQLKAAEAKLAAALKKKK